MHIDFARYLSRWSCLFLLIFSLPVHATIVRGTIDEAADVGNHVSLAAGGTVVAYYDTDDNSLKMATCLADCQTDTPVWQVVLVDDGDEDEADVGRFASIQLDSQGRPVIAYYDWEYEMLLLATCLSDCQSADPEWQYAVVDDGIEDEADVGSYASLQLDALDRPVIAYYDYTHGMLKLATCLSDCQSEFPQWQIVVADDGVEADADVGMHASLQLDSQDQPVIAYYDYSWSSLKLASCRGDCQTEAPEWDIVYLDQGGDEGADVGEFADLKLDSDDWPVISYHDYDNSSIKLATCVSNCDSNVDSRWYWVHVDQVDFNSTSSLALDERDHPLISYVDSSGKQLRLAACSSECWADSPVWGITTIDESLSLESDVSLQLNESGQPVIAYYRQEQGVLNVASLITPPAVVSVKAPDAARYQTDEFLGLLFEVQFDHAVFLTGDMSLELTFNSGTVSAKYDSGSGSHTLKFLYLVKPEDYDNDGIEVGKLSLGDSSTLQDRSGNDALLALHNVENTSGILINKGDFVVTSIAGGQGTVLPADAQNILRGQGMTFTLFPESGFDPLISGNCETTVESVNGTRNLMVTLSNVLGDCTLVSSFVSKDALPFAEDDEYRESTALEIINAAPAYLRGITGKGVKAGVIDNGIFAGSVEFYGTPMVGYDFITDDDDLFKHINHGTQVSGLVAGRRNGWGMHGVAYEADLVFARGIAHSIAGEPLANSFLFMKEQQARVINNSWGIGVNIDGTKGFADVDALEAHIDNFNLWQMFDAIDEVLEDDIVLVFSTGNDSRPDPHVMAGLPYYYPDLNANFIAVASVDSNGEISSFSNHCGVAAAWCVAAPGRLVQTPSIPVNNNRMIINSFSGTSASAPVVTGMSALLMEQFPWMNGGQIVSTILTTATNGTDVNLSPIIGRGIIDVGKAIDGPAAFEFEFVADTNGKDAVFANDISGTGNLIKTGNATLTLAGDNSYQGETTIEAGELVISGSLTSHTTLNGGTLSGTGSLASLTVNEGFLSPGASPGTLFTGDLVLSSSALLGFELKVPGIVGNGLNDLISVDGDLTLDGQLVIAEPNNLEAGEYTLFTYTGELTNNGLGILEAIPGYELGIVIGDGSVGLRVSVIPVTEPEPPVVSGPTTNTGTLNDPVIGAGGFVEGGTLSGNVQNQGQIRNVELAGGAQVSGGQVSGEITGSASNPARLNNTTIQTGARLENVVISGNTTLEPGVELGPNVKFESDANIPGGLDLSGALRKVQWSEGEQLNLVNLDDDIVNPDSGNGAPSLLRSIQLLGGFDEASGSSVDQQSDTGELLVVTADSRSAILPVKVTMANSEDEEGAFINDDGDVVMVTANRRVIVSYPSVQGKGVLSGFLASLGLDLAFDDRANLVMAPGQGNAASLVSGNRRLSALGEPVVTYFSARPDVSAITATTYQEVGVFSKAFPGLQGAVTFQVVFEDESGQLLQQDIIPVPVDWLLVKSSLLAFPEFDAVSVGADGTIRVQQGALTIKGRSGYNVWRDSADQADPDRVVFAPAGDINGDGSDDFMMIFPNGDRQELLVFPVH